MKNIQLISKEDKVTIIMPCFNAESTISKSIESVINQSYKNWELIIIDDCSTDNSFEIIKNYAHHESRIHILSAIPHEIRGPYFPRNLGLQKLSSKYLCFLDSDDFWESEKLKLQTKFMNKFNLDMSCTYYKKTSLKGSFISSIKPPKVITYKKLLIKNIIPLLTVMINLENIQDKRILKFPAMPHEDYALWLSLFKNNLIKKCYTVNKNLASYTVRENSISSNKIKSTIWTYHCYRWNDFSRFNSYLLTMRCLIINILIYLKNYFFNLKIKKFLF